MENLKLLCGIKLYGYMTRTDPSSNIQNITMRGLNLTIEERIKNLPMVRKIDGLKDLV